MVLELNCYFLFILLQNSQYQRISTKVIANESFGSLLRHSILSFAFCPPKLFFVKDNLLDYNNREKYGAKINKLHTVTSTYYILLLFVLTKVACYTNRLYSIELSCFLFRMCTVDRSWDCKHHQGSSD
jgi:hypothetical protein